MIKNFRNPIDNAAKEETVVNKKIDTSYFKNIEHKPLTSKVIGKSCSKEDCLMAASNKIGL